MEKKRKNLAAIAQSLGIVCFAVVAISSTSQKAVEGVNGFREGFEIATGASLSGDCPDIEHLQIDSVYLNQPDLALYTYTKNQR